MSSRFEFLGNTTLGQYIPQDSWFHRSDPRAKLLSFIALFTGIIFTRNEWWLLISLLLVVFIYFFAQLPFKTTWGAIKRALPFLVLLAILQLFFSPQVKSSPTIWVIFTFPITQSALKSAGILIFRFLILITFLNLIVMTISTAQITAALFYLLQPFEKLGFPVNDLTMVVQITLRFLPLVAQMAEKTAKAQAARGGDWDSHGFNPIRQVKRVLPLIIPLMVNSLKRAEIMAMAMESRGFNAAHKRSSFYVMHFSWQDAIYLCLIFTFSVLMLLIPL